MKCGEPCLVRYSDIRSTLKKKFEDSRVIVSGRPVHWIISTLHPEVLFGKSQEKLIQDRLNVSIYIDRLQKKVFTGTGKYPVGNMHDSALFEQKLHYFLLTHPSGKM